MSCFPLYSIFSAVIYLTFLSASVLHSQNLPYRLDLRVDSDSNPPSLVAEGETAPLTSWVLERSLAMSGASAGNWFSYYQPLPGPYGFYNSQNFSQTLRSLPAIPPPLPAVSQPPGAPRPRYMYAHTSLQIAANGSVAARWASLESDTTAETVFAVNELNLLNPDPEADNQTRPGFGIGISHQSASGSLPPLCLSYSVSQRPAALPMPVNLPALTGKDAFVRQGLLAFGPAIRADCWPLQDLIPLPPSPPPTLNDRSYYRIKALAALHDANGNGFPDELEGYFSHLLISEACYASLSPVGAHQPHRFFPAGESSDQPAFLNRPPDWVEILNPTGHAISARDYYFTDKFDAPTRFRLPDVTIPAYGTLILLLTDSPHPLFAAEADPGSLLRQCWVNFRLKDEGETVYLHQDTDPDSLYDPIVLVDSLTPPQGSAAALTGYTVGKVPRANHTWDTVFLPVGSPDFVNQGTGFTRRLSAPVFTEVPAAGGPAQPARSRLFRRAADLPRIVLSHPEPDAVITYTLDGSEPGPDDGIYEGPLEILSTSVIRARAFAVNAMPSATATRTYISTEGVLTQLAPHALPLGIPLGLDRFDPAVAAAWGHAKPPQRAGYPANGTTTNPGTKSIIEPKNRNEFEQKGTKATERTSSRLGRIPPEGERFSRTITT